MLKHEGSMRYWTWVKRQSPSATPTDQWKKIFPELVYGLAETLRQFMDGVRMPEVAAREFLIGTTLLKAAAYKSEREVRIVAIPGTAKAAKYAAKEYPRDFDATAPLPEIKSLSAKGKRHIALFDGSGLTLPVKRVIVGPGAGQDERAARARSLLSGVPVTISRVTPN